MIKNIFNLRNDLPIIYYSLKNKKLPIKSKLIIAIAIIYLISPIDLLPDNFIGMGLIDDLLVVPGLLSFSKTFIPSTVLNESKEEVEASKSKIKKDIILSIILFATIIIISIISKNL